MALPIPILSQGLPTLGLPDKIEPAIIETVDEDTGLPDNKVKLECQFNPTDLKIVKEVEWEGDNINGRNAPDLDFSGGKAATFELNLLFDTTRESMATQRDVRKYTNQLLKLTMLRKKGGQVLPPPLVRFKWGRLELFLAVVTKVTITYVLFHANGLPARAKAEVEFKQQDDTDDVEAYQNPTSRTEARKTRVVRHGERLDTIAYQEYRHTAYWRYLAEANHLLDPLDLRPGQILVIPPLP